MNDQNCITSACRYCRFYRPEGMHGGTCQQLNVSVRSNWKACQLGLPAFANSWENAEQLATANRPTITTPVLQMTEISIVARELSNTSIGNNN
ncbi:hypothetical protein [Chamaesiphon sp. VAR_48_metabat_403]|uniref:hypothetical protein n=1 Tax=Chamaesiphon sp. VAR_48_metabat_403 TaxID=2964700 RepID=UPI00286DC65F|nr:hypothetical protein [Chamaesiphon sp. VAR_48_metabat_403]